ncbi:hypothetical protein CCMSSC00406_0001096 [Pleurotus cornucopiae]|uniref:Uncharacterized protein n=1 Tax=Pleurotus cornucopiae TaxID=5321 RepID=A0ACB7IM81_PLECO|nr:hypothetical protein CCMSSC00406_0001096 [Pleurotus cornucopiae]
MATPDFASFQKTFAGDIVTPEHPDYAKAIARWAINAERKAKIVAYVRNAEDVALAIKYAQAEGLPIAIRGGGHSTMGGSSSENGLVIDLSRHLNTARIDPAQKLAYIGGGAVWATVDKAAIQHGLATVGGTVNHTGVGGLLLGGGFGWLTPAHGLTIDNLVQATIVAADGVAYTASETENPDLFWGIRGGGSNFGVLVEAVLKLYPQRRTVFAGPVIFKGDVFEEFMAVTKKWWESGVSDKEAIHEVFSVAPDGSGPCIVANFFYNGSEAEGRENFKEFYNLKPVVDFARELPYEELNGMQNALVEHGSGRYLKGSFFTKIDVESTRKAWDLAVKHCNSEHQGTLILEFVKQDKVNSVSPDAMAYTLRGGMNAVTTWVWQKNTPENLAFAHKAGKEVLEAISRGQQANATGNTASYGNYDHDTHVIGDESAGQSRARALFGKNYESLQVLQKKYDPNMIFNKWFVITPSS